MLGEKKFVNKQFNKFPDVSYLLSNLKTLMAVGSIGV